MTKKDYSVAGGSSSKVMNVSLGAMLVGGLAGSIFGLRSNNIRMVELRQAVFDADKSGEGIEEALQALRSHVLNHMNTSLEKDTVLTIEGEKPIQLVHQYYRDSITEYLRVTTASSPAHVKTLGEARAQCEVPTLPVTEWLPCVKGYTLDNGGSSFPVIEGLPKDFYTFDFQAPTWSPDLAGISLVVFAAGIVLTGTKLLTTEIFYRLARRNI